MTLMAAEKSAANSVVISSVRIADARVRDDDPMSNAARQHRHGRLQPGRQKNRLARLGSHHVFTLRFVKVTGAYRAPADFD